MNPPLWKATRASLPGTLSLPSQGRCHAFSSQPRVLTRGRVLRRTQRRCGLRSNPPGATVGSRGVRDQGRGLSPAQLQQISQGDRGLVALDAGGVGFGLLFVQRVALSLIHI